MRTFVFVDESTQEVLIRFDRDPSQCVWAPFTDNRFRNGDVFNTRHAEVAQLIQDHLRKSRPAVTKLFAASYTTIQVL